MPKTYCIALFAKAPIKGKVKTRLARASNHAYATTIYKRMLQRVIGMLIKHTAEYADIYLMSAEHCYHPAVRHASTVSKRQVAGNLGTKMSSASRMLGKNYTAVMLLGTDCPTLTPKMIQQAFGALEQGYDYALTPSTDGGYVMLAMRKYDASVFRNIAWSTSAVLTQTLNAIQRLNKTVYILPALTDIDHLIDYKQARRAGVFSYLAKRIPHVAK